MVLWLKKLLMQFAFMIVEDNLPLTITENTGFQNLIRILAPNFRLQRRKTTIKSPGNKI